MQFLFSLHPYFKYTEMKNQIQVFVPKPCHEDWNKMTPTQQGKFCASCQKQVVDFSGMTDSEVLNYFSKTTGNTCGRFAVDQLQRSLQQIKTEKKKIWWIAALMPFLLLFNKANAQKKNPKNTTTNNAATKNPEPIIMGKAMPREILPDTTKTIGDTVVITDIPIKKEYILHGKVMDQLNNEPIAYATVMIKGTNKATATNDSGEYYLKIPADYSNVILVISAIGFETVETTAIAKNEMQVKLENNIKQLPEVIVTTNLMKESKNITLGTVVTAGGAFACKKVTRHQMLDTTIRKAFKAEAFKKYPNPVVRGNILHIDTKRTGEYSVQIFDNVSKLLLAEDFSATENNTITEINIPSSFAGGVYYVRLINKKTKKEYTDKLIVQ